MILFLVFTFTDFFNEIQLMPFLKIFAQLLQNEKCYLTFLYLKKCDDQFEL